MENKKIEEMTEKKLLHEMKTILNASNLTESDRRIFLKILSEYKSRE